mmetsp:Transcript_10621/g.24732  ORF Transcript_10621/g.24732 Transcript_10621/m.24732 type:complete len:175 (+) Transcript_10621:102-626(+)|eukprot:CAMPEP_0172613686 /NCGR_PEP_ID=MMETSP1068-20121228/46031_1 /TAXON_ID=35684 /ORGANISM="Pseudopedinella elastica, Strain CCMP716" /LENGTH=174 /DNA_ID=CAMNT_0013418223 /DNA_START=78 /DNA_END=602 /DNA_ORIENTATION=-
MSFRRRSAAAPALLSLLALLLGVLPTAMGQKALITFTASRTEKLAVYFVGSTEEPMGDYEALVGVVDKGKSLTVDVEPKNAFVLRSTDMKFRAKVSVFDRPSDFDRPLALSFKNLAEGNEGEQMELKHSNSGFQWVPPSAEATHSTDFAHEFAIRSPSKQVLAAVRLDRVPAEL